MIDALNSVVDRFPRWGFWKCFSVIRREERATWNHKRVHRIYVEMGLNLPRRKKKRIQSRPRIPLDTSAAPNEIWAIDFMSDALYRGIRFRTFNVLDEGVREALDIVIDTSIPGGRVVRTLEQLGRVHGYPEAIRCDNGPEFLSQVFVDWCQEHQIEIFYIQPRKPNQNAYIERFNRTYRQEVLDAHLFDRLSQVREITYRWLEIYNELRPHDSLGRVPPAAFRRQLEKTGNSTYELST